MKIRYALPALAAAAALVLTGCVNNTEGAPAGTGTDNSASIKPDEAAVALLPSDIKDSGTLIIGTDAEYPPNEYKDNDGKPIGWGVNLANAVSAKLGLKPDWRIMGFDSIIPNITGGKVGMGSSSFTDTIERQKSVDFVNFYSAGVLWAAPIGKTVDPNNACGLKVAVQAGTYQHTDEVPAKSDKCVADGKAPIEILPFDGQAEATNAVVLGKAAAFSADSPVTLAAIAQLKDKIEASGETFDVAPYGFATKKDSEMTKAVQKALQSLMDDGTYLEILKDAGVESGAIDSATINAGNF